MSRFYKPLEMQWDLFSEYQSIFVKIIYLFCCFFQTNSPKVLMDDSIPLSTNF